VAAWASEKEEWGRGSKDGPVGLVERFESKETKSNGFSHLQIMKQGI
jgi:hypothetical protein